jgi:Helix-turn-helix domain
MSKREHVLQLLREAGEHGVTTAQFLEAGCGSRFGARVQELRDAGWVIDARRVRVGSHVYVLGQEPQAATPASATAVESLQLFEAPAPANALLGWEDAA